MEFLTFLALLGLLALLIKIRHAVAGLAGSLRALEDKLSAVADLVQERRLSPAAASAAGPPEPSGIAAEPSGEADRPTAPDETQITAPLTPETPAAAPEPAAAARDADETPPELTTAAAETSPDAAEGSERPWEAEPSDASDAPAEAPATPRPARTRSLSDIEKRFGTQWVVWVGGLALALGGIFLMRYSIEQGYFGPGARVLAGALLGLLLVAGGEWTRRQEIRLGISGAASAHIPSILTAAGTTVAYATVYGAYALYAFLSPAVAFALLGLVALGTLAAALSHGPALAGLGLVGAYVTPMLVATSEPSYWTLYIYLSVVTAAALGLARLRLWRWLALTAIGFGLVWMFPGIGDMRVDAISAHAFYAAAGFALAAAFIVAGLLWGPAQERPDIDPVSSGALGGYLFGAFLLTLATNHHAIALVAFALLAAATVAIALRAEAAAGAMVGAALLAVLLIAHWALEARAIHFDLLTRFGLAVGAAEGQSLHVGLGLGFAALFGGAAFAAQGRSEQPLVPALWAAVGVLAPIAILVALYFGIYAFARFIPFAGLALLTAACHAVAAETLIKRAPRPGLAAATAIFASGAFASLALALTFALEKGWLTVGLSLMAPGIAFVSERRPLPVLRTAVGVVAGLVLARMAWEPRVVGDAVGATPIFNWLLYGYGVPALAFWTAGYFLRRRADDVPARMTDSAAILFTVLLAFLEIRHLVYGDIYHHGTGLAELGLQVSTGLAMTIGLERLHARSGSIVHDFGARLLGLLSFLGIVFGLALEQNPMLTGDPVGGPVFNLVLLSYGLPAILMAILARVIRNRRPHRVYVTAAVTAIALALAYLTLEVRTLFHGAVLTEGLTSEAEQYAYSAVWLAFGVALLVAGIGLQSQPARLASSAVVTLAASKVFLYDLAGLQGVFRALSFIGLGLVLIGIGLLYQRLLFPARADTPLASP